MTYQKISSYDLATVAAFSVFRMWPSGLHDRPLERQWMNDIWVDSACVFYQSRSPRDGAAVFDPDTVVEVDGEEIALAEYFCGWGEALEDPEAGIRHGFVARGAAEINYP